MASTTTRPPAPLPSRPTPSEQPDAEPTRVEAYRLTPKLARRVATLASPRQPAVLRVQYRMRNGAVWLGTNAFFFEEGSDQRYAPARYGEFRVDRESGEAVLVGLRDAALKPL